MTTPAKPCPEPTDIEVGRKAVELGLITEMQLRDLLARMSAAQEAGDPPARNMAAALVKFGLITQKQLDGLRGDTAMVRKKFGKYTISRTLGRGGMGVVYEAIDTGLGRTVALKMLINNPQVPGDQAAVEEERFTREARLSANLPRHPGIVGVYESGVLEGRRYIAMEYIDGRRFEEWCSKSTGSLRGPVTMLRDVAMAVDHAHRHGVIHRDLKPANVLIDTDGRAHVTDFGLARQIRHDNSLTLTGGGHVMGTPTYISPEQAQGRKDVDRRTDVWALGVMLYELLAGRPPFRGETPVDVMMKIVKNPVPYPSAAVTRVGNHRPFDKTIENICMKALAKEPRDRYATAKVFADDLSRWLKGETIEISTAKRTKPSSAPWIAAGVAAVAAVVVAFFALSPSTPTVDQKAAERRDRVAVLIAQGKSFLRVGKNTDALIEFGKALELDEANLAAAAGKREAEQRIAASQAPRPAPAPQPVAPTPAPPVPAGPTPQELLKKATEFANANPKDIEGQIRVWQETRTSLAGTPLAADASRELEAALARRREVMAKDLAELDEKVNGLRDQEKFDTARDVLATSAKRREDPEWIAGIDARQAALNKALDELFASVRDQALEAQRKGDAATVKTIKARVERWRIPELSAGLDAAISAVVPAPKPAPGPKPTPAPTPAPADPARLAPVTELPRIEGHRNGIVSAAFSPDGKLLLTSSFDQTVRLWDLSARAERATLGDGGAPRGVAFSPDGRWMAAGYQDGKIRLWESGKSADRSITAHAAMAISIGFSPDSKLLASASTDGSVRLWDPLSGTQKGQLDGHSMGAMSVCWSPDGKLLAVACADRMVKLWDMPAGRERRSFTEGLEGTATTVALSRKFVAASGHDPRICVWDLETGKVRILNGHAKDVRAVACSPDGSWIASASADGTLRVWDASSGELRASVHDDGGFFGVSFSKKGDVLAGCAGSGLVRTWDVSTLRPSKPAPK